MRAAVAVLALAAATPARADRQPQPTPLEWRLQTRRTGTRVIPKPGARLFWTATARGAIRGARAPEVLPRLRDPSRDRVRVLALGQLADVAAYIDRGGLQTVARHAAIVTPARAAADRPFTGATPGIHLEPGALVHLDRRGPAISRVTVRDPIFTGSGFVRADAVGIDFTPRTATSPEGTWIGVVPGAVLRDRPGGGRVVVRLAREIEGDIRPALLLDTRGRYRLVACQGEGDVTAVGWVARRKTRDERYGLGLIGTGSGGGGYGGPRVILQVGTILRESRDGAVVGMMSRTSSVPLRKREGEWMFVEIDSALGDVELWAGRERASIGDGD